MFSRLVKQLAEKENVTEKLKAENQMLWVQEMNNIRNIAANKFRFPRKSIIKREIKYFAPTFGRFSYFYSFFERILVAVYDGQFL